MINDLLVSRRRCFNQPMMVGNLERSAIVEHAVELLVEHWQPMFHTGISAALAYRAIERIRAVCRAEFVNIRFAKQRN